MNKRFQELYMDLAGRVSQMSRAVRLKNCMNNNDKLMYMGIAKVISDRSYAIRLKVGCIVVKDKCIISDGRNGTPAGWDNACETKEWCSDGGWLSPEEIDEGWPYSGTYEDAQGNIMEGQYRLVTSPEVLHAERNAIDKLAKNHSVSGAGATMFVTHAPCLECAKSIYSAGIVQVYYNTDYRSASGIDFLRKCGVSIEQLN